MAEQKIKTGFRLDAFLYSYVFINLLRGLYYIFSLFNEKVRRGISGRKQLFTKLEHGLSGIPHGKRVWFHASSFGEFEQAKPIIELLKQSGYNIIASFFSPSGYEYSKSYASADFVTYLPIDTKRNARRFIELVRPSAAVFMRYDLWFNHLRAAKESGTKIILADATFPRTLFQRTAFLKNFYRRLYGLPDCILATTADQKKMFDSFLGSNMTVVAGDTRFDRVYGRSISNTMVQKLPFSIDRSKRTVLVLGSTWPQDIEVLSDGLNRIIRQFPSLTVIIVPHEPTAEEIGRIAAQFPESRILSDLNGKDNGDISVLIVDRVGILTQLYVVADIAYVGGGFGAGVHSVLEPAVYGIPIITGPRIEGSDEAVQLMEKGALSFVKDAAGAYRILLKMIEDLKTREAAGRIAKDYVNQHLGASRNVAEKVIEFGKAN